MAAPFRLTLSTHSSIQACITAIDALHARYKAEHKRNPTAALLCSHQFVTDTRVLPKDKVSDAYQVTLSMQPTTQAAAASALTDAQQAEIEWFKAASQ